MGKSSNSPPEIDWSTIYPNPQSFPTLFAHISQEEILQAISSWPSNKAPGPDNFTGEFYKKFKDLFLPCFLHLFNKVLLDGISLYPLNDSFVVLVPKKKDASKPYHYRPISLINGIQRIFSKILANQIQVVINQLIDETQTWFMKHKQITHGFLYAQHIIQHATTSNIQVALFKADLHKAFDPISSPFLLQLMRAKGLPETWLSCIQNGVLQGCFRVIVNGLAGKKIFLRRGVRQGDPLSPYLFILATDFLTAWFNRLTNIQALRLPFPGMKPCLLYADDALFFLQPTQHQFQILKIAFMVFHNISGLKLN